MTKKKGGEKRVSNILTIECFDFLRDVVYHNSSPTTLMWKTGQSGIVMSRTIILPHISMEDAMAPCVLDSSARDLLIKRHHESKKSIVCCKIVIFPSLYHIIPQYIDNWDIEEIYKKLGNQGFACKNKIGPEVALPIYQLMQHSSTSFKRVVVLHDIEDEQLLVSVVCNNNRVSLDVATEEIQAEDAFAVLLLE